MSSQLMLGFRVLLHLPGTDEQVTSNQFIPGSLLIVLLAREFICFYQKSEKELNILCLICNMKFWKKVYLFPFNYFFTCIYSNYTSDAVAKAITICHFRELQYKHTVNTQ